MNEPFSNKEELKEASLTFCKAYDAAEKQAEKDGGKIELIIPPMFFSLIFVVRIWNFNGIMDAHKVFEQAIEGKLRYEKDVTYIHNDKRVTYIVTLGFIQEGK